MTNKKLEILLEKLKNYTLSKPVTINDKTFTTLNVDFDILKNGDMEAIASLPECRNVEPENPLTFSKPYLLHIVAKAANVNIHDLRQFPIQDGILLTSVAQAFLGNAVSELTET